MFVHDNHLMLKQLSANNVQETLLFCLFKEGEENTDRVVVEGVKLHVGLHPQRVAEKTGEIREMLSQLPDSFMKTGGGGWSFLNACIDRDGNQWTGLHQSVDELICLGLATGNIEFLVPRTMWAMFPGAVPYFMVK